VRNCNDPDITNRKHFEQPVLQTLQMFVGEMGSWLVIGLNALYWRLKSRPDRRMAQSTHGSDEQARLLGGNNDEDTHNGVFPRNKNGAGTDAGNQTRHILLLALPAACDILGTTLMNVGLLLVAASIYQMTRGTLVLFVGLFSVIFLRRRLYLFQWVSLIGVVVGVGVVGLAGAIFPQKIPGHDLKPGILASLTSQGQDQHGADPVLATVGVLLIAGAQTFSASQFVLEEWILGNSVMEPIVVVGWEGTFGFVLTLIGMFVLHLTIGRTADGIGGPFDAVEGWRQMTSSKEIAISSLLIMISIG